MHRYIPATSDSQEKMLETIGAESVEELFEPIPEPLRLKNLLNIPEAMSELELVRHMEELSRRNADPAQTISFLGAGSNRHFIPAVVDRMLLRGEFLTAYTPYQPELSQGTLQALYEFQTLIAQLMGMEVANGSMYEGATAVVEAALMAHRINHKNIVAVSRAVHPHARETLKTYLAPLGMKLYELPLQNGKTVLNPELLNGLDYNDVACIVVQYPNFFGVVEELAQAREFANTLDALFVVSCTEPLALGIIKPPGDYGADIVVGEGQSFGIPVQFGGPYLGLFATRDQYVMQMPGRLVGATVDVEGKNGYVVTLANREQHIRRQRATSNICTNETLMAIGAAIFLSLAGPQGLREVAELNVQKAAWAKELITSLPGYDTPFHPNSASYTFNEFVVRSFRKSPREILAHLQQRNILGGVALEEWYPEYQDGFLVSVTELNDEDEIHKLASSLAEINGEQLSSTGQRNKSRSRIQRDPRSPQEGKKMVKPPVANGSQFDENVVIFEKGSPGRIGIEFPALDVPRKPLEELLDLRMIRETIEGFPEVSEHEVVRHYTGLSRRNYGIDTGMYPLGSCSMKPNPSVNEGIARLPHFAQLHPHTHPSKAQGALEVMWGLECYLSEICGMDAFTLAPAAGAHGELTGLLMIRKALEARGEKRTKILIPDSAHGTNPASAVYCGFKPIEVPSGPDGILEVETIEKFMDSDTAAIMLTNPNTLGLFEKNILEIAEIVHERGGFVYCDGANLNALMGIAKPGDMGIDVLQVNLHKTFSTPHGGGGPGAGPVGVKQTLVPFLPVPRIVRDKNALTKKFEVREDFPESIGRIRTFFGSFAVLLRAYAYIRALGPDGLRAVSETAVLNANYMLASLKDVYHAPFPDGCMHEFIITDKNQKKFGVKTLEIAKRLIDYGVHPMTIYFPLIVKGSMLVEPTEGEPQERIDHYIASLHAVARDAQGPPELLKMAPHFTPVRLLDETRAARKRNLRWRPDAESE